MRLKPKLKVEKVPLPHRGEGEFAHVRELNAYHREEVMLRLQDAIIKSDDGQEKAKDAPVNMDPRKLVGFRSFTVARGLCDEHGVLEGDPDDPEYVKEVGGLENETLAALESVISRLSGFGAAEKTATEEAAEELDRPTGDSGTA